MTGYESLKAAVIEDCKGKEDCFNEIGCSYNSFEKCKCTHRYCDKFAWVVERAKHYGEKLGVDWNAVLDSWESKRDYWYMNYYQNSNQPRIEGDGVRVFDTVEDLLASIGKREFRCPMCRGISTDPYSCNSGKEMSPGKVCDWKVYGLFQLSDCPYTFCKDQMRGQRIFMPLAWEVTENEV